VALLLRVTAADLPDRSEDVTDANDGRQEGERCQQEAIKD
jgi:hypothetical protein